MKKFMWFIALLFVAPSAAVADTIGGVVGGVAGVGLGSLIGHGNGTIAAEVILGLVGANTGSRIEDGTYGRNASDVIYVTAPGPYPSQYGYGGFTPSQSQGMYLQQGMCDDVRSGGQVSCRFLTENPRYECCGIVEHSTQSASQVCCATPQVVSASTNMWERPERRQKAEVEVKKVTTVVLGPTTMNYMDPNKVNDECQTGNHGADGHCLLRLVDPLMKAQMACEEDMRGPECKKNPGIMAGIYHRLGNELIELQNEEQSGVITLTK